MGVDLSVAMVTTWKTRCGIFTYSENLAKSLAKLGVNVYIIRIPFFGFKIPEILQNVVDRIPIDKIDVVHVQHEYGLYQNLEKSFYPALKNVGKPIVTTMHSVGAWEVDEVIANLSERIIVHNEFCARRFGHHEKTGIIPHGATPLENPPPPANACKKMLGINPRSPLVGYMGFISSYKGLETLIEAMIKVPNTGLLIGGGWHVERETEYIMRLKDWTLKDLPRRCRWLGYVSEEHLATVYGAMDIVVYPSRFATESGALIMALSHRKPMLASNVAPFREKAKVGALMIFNDAKDLSNKIKKLLKDEKLRTTLAEGAREYTEKWAWPEVAKIHIQLYRNVLRGKD